MGILSMMSNHLVQGGAQIQLNCSRKPKGERHTCEQQAMTIHSEHSRKRLFTQILFFFKATNTTYHWTPVLQLLYDGLNTDDNSAHCSLDQSSLHTLKYIPLE